MRRKWPWVALVMVLVVGAASAVWAAGETYKGYRVVNLFIGEKKVESDVPPIIFDDRTLLPARALTEALGADVKWDGVTYTATVLPRPAMDWGETAGKLRLHLKGVKQLTGADVGNDALAGQIRMDVQVVNDGTADQRVDLSRLQLSLTDSSDKRTFVLPHVLEVKGDRQPAPGSTIVTLSRGERVTVSLGYDFPAVDTLSTPEAGLVLTNSSGGVDAALRIKVTITIDCSQRPCKFTITISF